MAKTLDKYTPKRKTPGPVPKYPWDKWLDGQIWVLEKGIPASGSRRKGDFTCEVATMADNVRKTARRRGYGCTVHEEDAKVVIVPTDAEIRKRSKAK